VTLLGATQALGSPDDGQVPAARYASAVIHGRFQPLHIGHLEYLLAGIAACRCLIVGITNPDPRETLFEPTNPARGLAGSNPCTFYERYLMVEGALLDSGVPLSDFRIVPFPHGTPERLDNYAPHDAQYLLTIYDDWGETKLERFRHLGLSTHVLWRRTWRVTSSSDVRRRIAAGEEWEQLVPQAVAHVIKEYKIDERIRNARR
jgi:nicotinamide mononucleotide adenylyltransferase